MLRVLRVCLPVVVLSLAAVAAQAMAEEGPQRPGRREGQRPPFGGGMMMFGGGGGGSGLFLLSVEPVQKELQLVDEQKTKIKELIDSMRTEMQGAMGGRRGPGGQRPGGAQATEQPRRTFAQMQEARQKREAEIRKKLEQILLPNQLERLDQISLQLAGAQALAQERVLTALKVTAEQKKKLEEAREAMQKKFQALFQGGQEGQRQRPDPEAIRKLQEEALQQELGVLTNDQQAEFKKMTGEKFELDRSQLFGGFGRRPGGEGPRRGPAPQ